MPLAKQPMMVIASFVLTLGPIVAFGEYDTYGVTAPSGETTASIASTDDADPAGGRVDPQSVTASVPQRVSLLTEGGFAEVVTNQRLKRGLDALAGKDIAAAQSVRDSLAQTSLDQKILSWAIAMDGRYGVTTEEIEDVLVRLPDWPGAETLRRNLERAVVRARPTPAEVVKIFAAKPPLTTEGATALARAHIKLGDRAAARAALATIWRTGKLDAAAESRIIKEFGDVLTVADHRFRMERMLYAERPNSANRFASLGQASELAAAWTAVLRNNKNARTLLDAVPVAQRGAGFAFAEAKYLRRTKKYAEAAKIIIDAPRDAETLVDPDEWWVERRVLSRELVDHGDMATAYKLAAAHSAESPANTADAEFHAGWYALRGLSDPATAAKHFGRIAELAEGPITSARAYYWLGRAAEAGGPGSADTYYRKAALFSTAFYGQLAAVKLGTGISLADPTPSDADRGNFSSRLPVKAIRRLEEAGYGSRADYLYRELARQLTSAGELALLAAMAETRGDHHLALRVAKLASGRGLDIGALSHPVGAIPASADISGAGKALAYAIARQESEFNVAAVSGAGALGLLQLMPGTAKEVAKTAGLAYSREKLTEDAGYNATLGAAFLSEQLGSFKGSYVLTFAGYNAGPGRARQWMKRYGDPRGKDIDTVVDWIERIPYSETRSYVQRVMENYQVYKTRLTGKFDLKSDLTDGR